ncbi:hypothetical protein DM02DRAFT_12935 [Periconia macrospinosa]|uniref:PCI domain-containing protein n=1 Tax=Periconia macrospinosa TaxID=97972 RepID=A0A2V1E868_9PLEO|nr:hypothetical protein DM02DRAFT_12935 [Periconia macrospinosa]
MPQPRNARVQVSCFTAHKQTDFFRTTHHHHPFSLLLLLLSNPLPFTCRNSPAAACSVYFDRASRRWVPRHVLPCFRSHRGVDTELQRSTCPHKPHQAVTSACSQSTSPVKPAKVDWPPAVREYVGRAFEGQNTIKGISREDVTKKLKEVIGFFAERSQLDSVTWSTYPLPQELLRDERLSKMDAAGVKPTLSGTTNTTHDNTPSKKRKSQDRDELQPQPTPGRKTNNLEDRITFAGGNEKRHKKNGLPRDTQSKFDQNDLEKRKQRFNLGTATANRPMPPWVATRNDSDSDMNTAPVVGTNQRLEKQYLRLTAPPKAETVRPQHVLEKTLQMLTRKWKEEKNYGYICNQFKSLRQDLTVQHIKNAFTVKVYELHARIALEKGDLGEYNQCQTQLKALYSQRLGGNPAEFTAYRILYFVYTCNKTDMNDLLAELTPADKTHPWIKHALDVRSSLALGNYHKFFQLYLDAPNMGSYLMDMFIERERLHALANISKAYVPTLEHVR